jgi:hypothetical protein
MRFGAVLYKSTLRDHVVACESNKRKAAFCRMLIVNFFINFATLRAMFPAETEKVATLRAMFPAETEKEMPI